MLGGAHRPGTFIGWPYLSMGVYALPRAADSPREINEAERPAWMRGPYDPKSPEISNFACLRGGSVQSRGRDPESIRLAVLVTCGLI